MVVIIVSEAPKTFCGHLIKETSDGYRCTDCDKEKLQKEEFRGEECSINQ